MYILNQEVKLLNSVQYFIPKTENFKPGIVLLSRTHNVELKIPSFFFYKTESQQWKYFLRDRISSQWVLVIWVRILWRQKKSFHNSMASLAPSTQRSLHQGDYPYSLQRKTPFSNRFIAYILPLLKNTCWIRKWGLVPEINWP